MLILETLVFATLLAVPSPQGCGHSGPSQGGHSGHGGAPSRQAEPERPKVHATNTICPVMGNPVKPGRDREVVVGGEYYLVCCDSCGPEMAEHKAKYLDKEGKPLNTPKKDEAKSEPKTDEPSTEHKH